MTRDEYLAAIRAGASQFGPNAEFSNLGTALKTSGGKIYNYQDYTPDARANGMWALSGMQNMPEAAGYTWSGFNSPQYREAFDKQFNGGMLSQYDLARLQNPNAIGLVNTRPDIVAANPMGKDVAELSFYGEGGPISWTPEQRAAIARQWANTTPAMQDDGDGGVGGLVALAMLVAAIYTGGAAAGLWGGATAAGTAAGTLAAESAALMEAGFSASEIAGSLAGLGDAASISSVLTSAGVSAAEAGALAGEAVSGGLAHTLGGQAAQTVASNIGTSAGGGMDWTDLWSQAFGEGGAEVFGEGAGEAAGLGGGMFDTTGLEGLVDASGNITQAGEVGGGMFDTTGLEGLVDASGNITQAGLAQMASQPGLLERATAWMANNPGKTFDMAMKAVGGGLNLAGGLLQGNAAANAARTSADAQVRAAQIAADAAKFKPVGVTTRFGSSNFGYDSNGNLTRAGYTLTPEMKALQDSLMGAAPGMMNQFTGAQAATAPMGTAAQRAMTLGNQYLATDPQAQALKYMQDQQALLATGRERDMGQMLSGEFNRGTYGLATGGTSTGMGAANPRLEAMMNAQRQQDLGLAANATQGGMDYAKFGAGTVGTGGDLLNSMYGVQSNAYSPFATALGGAQTIEGLGQNALTQGMNLGSTVTAANAAQGGLLSQGMTNAAKTVQPANAHSPWGNLLSGAGNMVQNYGQPQPSQLTPQQQAILKAIWS